MGLTADAIFYGFLWYMTFLFSTTCHEASHALVAKLGGDQTAARGGQVTLNPVPHIQREPWGMVVIPIAMFFLSGGSSMIGWASAPFDPDWQWRYPRRAALMALAGPAANFTLMILAAIGIQIARHYGAFFSLDPAAAGGNQLTFLGQVLFTFCALNLLLGVFNLLPVPPLDGSTGIMLFMGDKQARNYLDWMRGTSFGLIGVLAAMVLFRYGYQYIEGPVMHLLLRRYF